MKGKHDTKKHERSTQAEKSISIEMPELEKKIPGNRRNNNKIPPSQKKLMHKKKGRTHKHKLKEKTQHPRSNRTLDEAEAKEIERRSMTSSSTEKPMVCFSSE